MNTTGDSEEWDSKVQRVVKMSLETFRAISERTVPKRENVWIVDKDDDGKWFAYEYLGEKEIYGGTEPILGKPCKIEII